MMIYVRSYVGPTCKHVTYIYSHMYLLINLSKFCSSKFHVASCASFVKVFPITICNIINMDTVATTLPHIIITNCKPYCITTTLSHKLCNKFRIASYVCICV